MSAVIGDGAVGLCATSATDVVSERGFTRAMRGLMAAQDNDLSRSKPLGVMELTKGAHSMRECVGAEVAIATAVGIARPGGAIGRVGVPHYEA